MPPHQRFRLDNRNDLQDRWKPSIHLDEEPAVVVARLRSTPHLAPQDDQLMSEHRILRLKPALRLERRGQHDQNKPNQRDHRASLADSVTRKIRIRFSVHSPALGNRVDTGPPFDTSKAQRALRPQLSPGWGRFFVMEKQRGRQLRRPYFLARPSIFKYST